ncbi:MAG: hypothetical protein ACJ76B_05150 [Solirubrobacterales bacterium]
MSDPTVPSNYSERGWSVAPHTKIEISVPEELAYELDVLAARELTTRADLIADAIADAVEFGWTSSNETLEIPKGKIPLEVTLAPELHEDLERRRQGLIAKKEGEVSLSAVIAAIAISYLQTRLRSKLPGS